MSGCPAIVLSDWISDVVVSHGRREAPTYGHARFRLQPFMGKTRQVHLLVHDLVRTSRCGTQEISLSPSSTKSQLKALTA